MLDITPFGAVHRPRAFMYGNRHAPGRLREDGGFDAHQCGRPTSTRSPLLITSDQRIAGDEGLGRGRADWLEVQNRIGSSTIRTDSRRSQLLRAVARCQTLDEYPQPRHGLKGLLRPLHMGCHFNQEPPWLKCMSAESPVAEVLLRRGDDQKGLVKHYMMNPP